MAGDWIKVETTTPDKPEVFKMAEILEIDPDAVCGKLLRVWIWADQQTFDGNAGSVTELLLDRIAGVSGFAKAMAKTGWLEKKPDGFALPNFDRHNGKTAKTRALTRKRVSDHRNAGSVTSALPEKRREEKRIQDNNAANELPPDPKPDPKDGCPPEFETWWSSYPKNAKGRKRGKRTCLGIWKRIPANDRTDLAKATKHYASEQTEFIRDPERFLKQDFWRDYVEPPDKASTFKGAQPIEGIGIDAYNAGWEPESESLEDFLDSRPGIVRDYKAKEEASV